MKILVLLSTLFISASAMAFSCDAVLLKQENNNDLTVKIIETLEDKGYRISQLSESEIIALEGSYTHLTIAAVEKSEKDVRADIEMKDVIIRSRRISANMNMNMQFSKKTLLGSAKKSLLKSIESSIPNCFDK